MGGALGGEGGLEARLGGAQLGFRGAQRRDVRGEPGILLLARPQALDQGGAATVEEEPGDEGGRGGEEQGDGKIHVKSADEG